jgi:hypothetical protein
MDSRKLVSEPTSSLPARLIQVVARFRPDADGVGETALNLAHLLRKDHSIRSDFLVYNHPRHEQALEIPDDFPYPVERVCGTGGIPFNSALDRLAASSGPAPAMLLHYVPYGYSPQGTPTWLPASMERFIQHGGRLLTLFHELYASPRLTSRTLFTSWLQRRIFRRLLAATEFAFTSSSHFLEMMERDNHAHRPTGLIGICSSAGEPEHPRPLSQRKRRLAVFGRFATRQLLYTHYLPVLERIANHLGIEEIADIGAVDDSQWMEKHVAGSLGRLLRSYGTLSVEAASQLLEDSIAGTLLYPYSLRGKSSVFAAYQAHAMAIVLFPWPGKEDEREPGSWTLTAEDLLALPPQSSGLQSSALFDRLQQAATAGHRHYQDHRSARSMCQTLLPALSKAGDVAQAIHG